jgi:hypothetical protein
MSAAITTTATATAAATTSTAVTTASTAIAATTVTAYIVVYDTVCGFQCEVSNCVAFAEYGQPPLQTVCGLAHTGPPRRCVTHAREGDACTRPLSLKCRGFILRLVRLHLPDLLSTSATRASRRDQLLALYEALDSQLALDGDRAALHTLVNSLLSRLPQLRAPDCSCLSYWHWDRASDRVYTRYSSCRPCLQVMPAAEPPAGLARLHSSA